MYIQSYIQQSYHTHNHTIPHTLIITIPLTQKALVQLPPGEDRNEWLAVTTVDIFTQLNHLYGAITEFCTNETCPIMCAGPKFEYQWADGVKITKPIQVSAPKYVEYLMEWVQSCLDNDKLFPGTQTISSKDDQFPKHFESVVKQIFKRLFRVYAHIYYHHFDKVVALGVEPHLNTCFRHFYYFVKEFKLVDEKEMAPLQEVIDKMIEGKK